MNEKSKKELLSQPRIMPVYAIRDTVADEYAQPFCAPNDAVAIRNFRNSIERQQVEPSEFSLARLAVFNFGTGELVTEPRPQIIEVYDTKE